MLDDPTLAEDVLAELFQNAAFDRHSFGLLEAFVKKQSREPDPTKLVPQNILIPEILDDLSTSRNRNLISSQEQDLLRKTLVGFFGLSVGSHAAISWIMESRALQIKIIDPDTISPTNLNRLKFGWKNVGKKKIDVTSETILELNPFTKIIKSLQTDSESVRGIFFSHPEIDLVVDAIDDIQGKILLRKLSRDKKIPLVSAADVGDNIVLDVERYDIDPKTKPFLGRVNFDEVDFETLSPIDKKKLIVKLVGFEENSEQLLESLNVIGKSLSTWPQLGATATIAGGIIATTIKKIILGEKVLSGRYYFSLDQTLVSDFNSQSRISKRKLLVNKVKQELNV